MLGMEKVSGFLHLAHSQKAESHTPSGFQRFPQHLYEPALRSAKRTCASSRAMIVITTLFVVSWVLRAWRFALLLRRGFCSWACWIFTALEWTAQGSHDLSNSAKLWQPLWFDSLDGLHIQFLTG
jgi:hypothetical protein